MAIYYAETGSRACLEEAVSLKAAKQQVLRECGTYAGIQVLRKATEDDIAWVQAMGGWVPRRSRHEDD